MRYKVKMCEVRKGEITVEAENEKQAKSVASGEEIAWAESEITNVTVEPDDTSEYSVVEVCPHCENEIEMQWDMKKHGYKAFCPVCGKRLMLCSECVHSGAGGCDYNSKDDSCRFNPDGINHVVVIHSNYAEGMDAYIFEKKEDALKSIRADAETEMTNLKINKYSPILTESFDGEHLEVYVKDSNIYYEWSIIIPLIGKRGENRA